MTTKEFDRAEDLLEEARAEAGIHHRTTEILEAALLHRMRPNPDQIIIDLTRMPDAMRAWLMTEAAGGPVLPVITKMITEKFHGRSK